MCGKFKGVCTVAALSAAAVINLCAPATAGVEKVLDDSIRGGTVYGTAYWYSDDGCQYSWIAIDGQEERGDHTNITSIIFYQHDWCNKSYTRTLESLTLYQEGILVAPDSKLVYAELSDWAQLAVEHCDFSSGETLCTPGEARVTARWAGFGNTYQGHGNSHDRVGPTSPSDKFAYMTHSRYNGADRDADFEFQVEIDGVPVHFSSYTSYGTLKYVKSGRFEMYRITP